VPFRGSGGGGWYAAPEVRDLAHLLRAADDPTDSFSVVGALRSGACGCSDDDLVRYHALAGRFDPRRPHNDGPQSVLDGLALIAGLHRERRGLTLSELVRRAIERTGLIPFSLAGLGGAQPAANARQLLALARTVEGSVGGGLREFVRWIERQRQLDLDEDVAGVPEDADDVVRGMTMHGAKGLEFPIVILAGLANKPNKRNNPIPHAAEHRLELKLGSKDDGFATPSWDDALAQEKVQLEAELKRLLYVAVTRARDFLVVPAIPNVDKWKDTFLELLAPALPGGGDLDVSGASATGERTDGSVGRSGVERRSVSMGAANSWKGEPWPGHDDVSVYAETALASVDGHTSDNVVNASATATAEMAAVRDGWSTARAGRRAEARRGRELIAASAQLGPVAAGGDFAEAGDGPADEVHADAERRAATAFVAGHPKGAGRSMRLAGGPDAPVPVGSGAINRRSANVGSAVHLVMERVSLADPEVDLTDLVQEACDEFEVPDAVAEVTEMSRNCLRSAAVRQAANAENLWRELAVTVQDGEVTAMGRIDLLFRTGHELVLVDYKTDRVGVSDIAALEARHAGQMAAYAKSLMTATGFVLTRTEVVPARARVEPAGG
jgi:ATP-dependent helicase/nuclease subunit A